MTEWRNMCEQIGKTRYRRTHNKWINPNQYRTENEFPDVDAIPYGMTPPISPDATSFQVIKKQVRKRKLSKKTKKERIADKSVFLADKLGYRGT